LEPATAAVVVAALKFSQHNVLWGSFPQAQGVKGLFLVLLYFIQVWPQHLSKVLELELTLSASVLWLPSWISLIFIPV
jgi:hypothetical protein